MGSIVTSEISGEIALTGFNEGYAWGISETGEEHRVKIEFLEPVPLNKERLLQVGFEEKEHGLSLERFVINEGFEGIDSKFSFRLTTGPGEYTFITSIKFLHQLQNICFDLSKKELQIHEPHE